MPNAPHDAHRACSYRSILTVGRFAGISRWCGHDARPSRKTGAPARGLCGLGDALDDDSDVVVLHVAAPTSRSRQVGLRDDADAASVGVGNDNASNLTVGHHAFDLLEIRFSVTGYDIARHELGDARLGRFPLCDTADRDVAIGDDTDHPAVVSGLDHGNASAVIVGHELCDALSAVVWRDACRALRHEVLRLHGAT